MMSDIPPTLQEQLKPLFLKKDDYSEKLCRNGKEIRKVQLELIKQGEPPAELLRHSQRLIDETAYLTAKLRALEREIAGWRRSRRPQLSKSLICERRHTHAGDANY